MIKNIVFDFDGVILDSVPVKTLAFRHLFSSYSKDSIDEFIIYHEKNGGVSRFKKIEYFFKKILDEPIDETLIDKYAKTYSELTKETLADEKFLIDDTLRFIQKYNTEFNMHIASGADENDLLYICRKLNIDKFFKSIHGSPTPKVEIIESLLKNYNYKAVETVLIGDSINDYEAARDNGIAFLGYNNSLLQEYTYTYLKKMEDFFNYYDK